MRLEKLNRPGNGLYVFIICALAVAPATVHAWGSKGHRIVAEIAQRHLDATASQRVDDLLDGRKLPEVATWSDEIRSIPGWSCAGPFHYVTVPPDQSYFEYNKKLWKNAQRPEKKRRDMDQPPAGDSLRALVYFETVLNDDQASHEAKRNALAFMVHLVGDMHMPLHNGRGCDRGGNSVTVDFFDEETNLHSVWDTKLIESERLSFTEFANFIDHYSQPEIELLASASPIDWVNQAQTLLDDIYTCDATSRGDRCTCFCGDCSDGKSVFGGCQAKSCSLMQAGPVTLRYGYKAQHSNTLREQLGNGGVRLAAMLNRILSDTPEQYPGHSSYQKFRKQLMRMNDWQKPVMQCMQANQQQ